MKYNSLFIIVVVVVVVAIIALFNKSYCEGFYNIVPTELIDPQYYYDRIQIHNNEQITNSQITNSQIPDEQIHDDLNCNNVRAQDIITCLGKSDPRILYEYVYRYDPSISLCDPVDAPRVLKQLLRNMPAIPCSFNNKNKLPFVNPCLQVLKRCPIEQIQIS